MTLALKIFGCFEQLFLMAASDFLKIFPFANFTIDLLECIIFSPKVDKKPPPHFFDLKPLARCYLSPGDCRVEVSLNSLLWESWLVCQLVIIGSLPLIWKFNLEFGKKFFLKNSFRPSQARVSRDN